MRFFSENSDWKIKFYTIAAGQTISLIGSSAVQFALIWWLAVETNSPTVLSIAGLMSFLPMLFLGPFAGVWVDRLRLKTVLVYADLFIALCAAFFALVAFISRPTEILAYIILLLRGVGGAFHGPAMQKTVPMLVPAEQLVRVNGVTQFIQSGAFMLGPVFGAMLYGLFPLHIIMLTDVAGALFAVLGVAFISIPDAKRSELHTPHIFREMREGMKILLSLKKMFVVTLASTLCMVAYLPLSSLYPLMTSHHLGGTEWHAGIVEMLYAAGMMIASLYLSARGEFTHKYRMMHIGLFVLGITALLSGLLPNKLDYFWQFSLLCAFMGAGGSLFHIPYTAQLQRIVQPEAMGRVFSLIGSLMSLAMPVGLLIAGPLAQRWGVAYFFFVSGVGTLIITALSMAVISRIREQN